MQGGQAWLYGVLLVPFTLLVPVSWIAALFQGGPSGLVANGWGYFCFSGVVAVLGPLILALPIIRLTQSARVYERGLVHWSLLGTTTVRADEVTEIVHTIRRYKIRTVDELLIRRRGQRGFFIIGIDRAAELANVVHAWSRGQGAPMPAASAPWTPPAQQSAPQQGWAAPQQSAPQQGWAPPQQIAAQQGWAAPQQSAPQQGWAAPPQSAPQQGWAPPPQSAPQQGWAAPQQGWAPPQQSAPQQGWAPPQQSAPQQGWAPPAQQSSGWPPSGNGDPPEGGR